MNLDAYLERIGYTGPRTPTLATLRELQLRHALSIPFENLNPLLRLPVPLDIPSIEAKLVQSRRGGWCFEHNFLFRSALEQIGFTVRGLAGRVVWNQPEDTVNCRGHMVLEVELDRKTYIADVGFGGQTLTGPLLLEPDIEQQTPHGLFRVVRAGPEYKMQVKLGGAWRSMYRFDLQEQQLIDYEMASHFLSTHPSSHFLVHLTVARPAEDRRYALRDNRLSVHHLDGPTEHKRLESKAELRRALEDIFLIAPPEHPGLDELLEGLARSR